MARETLDVQTNIPFTAHLKYCDERNTSNGKRLKLVLVVDDGQEDYPAGEKEMWGPVRLIEVLKELAAVDELAPTDKGRQFKVLGSPHLKIVRKEIAATEEKKKHSEYRVERLDSYTPRKAEAAPAATSAGPGAPTGNGLDVSKVEGKRESFKRWVAVGEKYAAACFLADRALTALLWAEPDGDQPTVTEWGDLVQRGAATILIEAGHTAPGFTGLLAALEQHYNPPTKADATVTTPPNAPEPDGAPSDEEAAGQVDEAKAERAASGTPDDDLPF